MVYTVLAILLILITGGLCIPETYLYWVDYSFSNVYRIDPAQPQRYSVPISGLQYPTAIGYDEHNEHLYVFNGHLNEYNTTKYILKYHANSGSTRRQELLRSARVSTAAVDSGSGLLYYAERIERAIMAVTTDFRYQTVIIYTDLETSDIALDTVNKAMYWCDWSDSSSYIGKANMDGSSRRHIVTHGLYLPYAITLDVPDNKIYWVDQKLNQIERCNLDGTGRESVLILDRMDSILFSVAVDETYVYWVQRHKGAIYKRRKNGVQSTERVGTEYPINTTDYRSLRLVRTTPPPKGTNACSGGGGCQHICIPTIQSWVCRCSEGYVLQPDGKSCQEASFTRGVVTVDQATRVLKVLDLDTNATKKLTDTWYSDPRGIALDETTFEIFWTDRFRRAIFMTCIPKPCFKVIRPYTEQESNLGDVALDTQRKNIYVGDTGLGQITKMSYSGTQEEVIIQGGFRTTSVIIVQIALDTNTRKIYWATVESIEVANMDDGSDRRQLQTGLNIGGLVLDTPNQRLYVLRYDNGDIEVMDLTRGNSLQLVHRGIGNGILGGLALGDGMLYFSNSRDGSIHEYNMATQEVKKYGLKKFRETFSMVYFNRNPQAPVPTGTVSGATPVSGAIPEGMTTTASSSGGLLDKTLIIVLSVLFGGIILTVGIIICGVIIYKRILMSVKPNTTVDLPLQQPPSNKDKEVSVTDSLGENSEVQELPVLSQTRPCLPLPPQRPPNRINRARDASYLNPIETPPSSIIRAEGYVCMQGPRN